MVTTATGNIHTICPLQ